MRFGWGSIGASAIATNPLLVAPFQALSSPPLFSVAVDLIGARVGLCVFFCVFCCV